MVGCVATARRHSLLCLPRLLHKFLFIGFSLASATFTLFIFPLIVEAVYKRVNIKNI